MSKERRSGNYNKGGDFMVPLHFSAFISFRVCSDALMPPYFSRFSRCWLGPPPLSWLSPTPSVIDGRLRTPGCASYIQVPTTTVSTTCCIGNIQSVARRLGPVYILLRDSSSCSQRLVLWPSITRSLIHSGNRASSLM